MSALFKIVSSNQGYSWSQWQKQNGCVYLILVTQVPKCLSYAPNFDSHTRCGLSSATTTPSIIALYAQLDSPSISIFLEYCLFLYEYIHPHYPQSPVFKLLWFEGRYWDISISFFFNDIDRYMYSHCHMSCQNCMILSWLMVTWHWFITGVIWHFAFSSKSMYFLKWHHSMN